MEHARPADADRAINGLVAQVRELTRERDEALANYHNACKAIAEMQAIAVRFASGG